MRLAKIGDVYADWNEEIKKWTLVQVIQEKAGNQVALLNLDNYFDDLPRETNLSNLRALIINHHNWSDHYSCKFISTNLVPERLKFIANITPVLETVVNKFSAVWPKDDLQAILQYKWNLLDLNTRTQYKKARGSNAKIQIGNQERRVNTYTISLVEKDNLDLGELSKLPALNIINFKGNSTQLIDCVSSNVLIEELEWSEQQQETIDISKTNINKLIIDVTKLKKLILNTEIRFLSFTGDLNQLNNLEIVHPRDGRFLEINIYAKSEFELPNFGLTNLSKLTLLVYSIDFNAIVNYPNLNSLVITGRPGFAQEFGAVSKLKKLETLELHDLFGFKVDDVPEPSALPSLEFLRISSIPKDVGAHIKKQFKDISLVDISQLRDEKWMTENLENPFRDWDGREGISAANAKKAFGAFKKLNSVVEKNPSKSELIKTFTDFIDVFNTMDKKSGCIETIEREEIYEAYMGIVDKVAQHKEELFELFEKCRSF